MLEQITFYPILGKPLIMYGGIFTMLAFAATGAVAIINQKGIRKIPFIWHTRLAYLSFALAIFHGLLGLMIYF